MMKDVNINNRKSPSKERWNFVPTQLIRAELPRLRDVGDSVLYHSPLGLAS